MTTAIQRSETGTGRFVELTQGLRFAEVSDKAFPADPQQTAMRKALRDKKAGLDQRIAILKAFGAASEWDPLIDKYADFEEYDDAFEDVRKHPTDRSGKAKCCTKPRASVFLTRSSALPRSRSFRWRESGTPAAASWRYFSMPSAPIATPEAPSLKRPDPTRSQMIQIQQLLYSGREVHDGWKIRKAEADIAIADGVLKNYPSVVLTRAKLLRARHEYDKAVETLDTFDQLTLTDEEAKGGAALRSEITYEKESGRTTARRDIAKAEADGDYVAAFSLRAPAFNWIQAIPTSYHAGLDAAITRDSKDAPQFWRNYLAASQSLTSESKRRTEVLTLLPEISAVPKPRAGTPNWFSNSNVAPGLMYDPVSLAPNFHPADVSLRENKRPLSNGIMVSCFR